MAFVALVCIVAIVLGGANEIADLGLFAGGYPTPVGDDDFGSFAANAAALAVIALGMSIALERLE